MQPSPVLIQTEDAELKGDLCVPESSRGVILFAHGSGSGRKSSRNQFVASELNRAGFGTLLIDLLTEVEEREDAVTVHLRFDIDLLANRLSEATAWLKEQGQGQFGYFGASTGAAAAIMASLDHPQSVRAVVSRGGRPDLAGPALTRLTAPTLLIVGSADEVVLELNRVAQARMAVETQLSVVEGATHLFPEPGALERVAQVASDWFAKHL